GYDFGRLAHLLDAVDDYDSDARDGSFNPLRATGTEVATALDDCRRLARAIRRRYRDLDLADDRLLRAVLVDGVRQAVSSRTHRLVGCMSGSCARTSAGSDTPLKREEPSPKGSPFRRDRRFHERILPFIGVSCTGYACCSDHWNHCTDEWKPAWCNGDCSPDCGDSDNCCNCCDCCDCDDCDCDCCGCDC
ncbi:MAG: regulator, partial [Gordonia amarae]